MYGLRSGVETADSGEFDTYDEFVPEHIPEPDGWLCEHAVLTDRDHLAVHRMVRQCFEQRGVYDLTFGYNLARLNLDARHPDAGFRYARTDDGRLRVTFTPTTEFCPQAETLALGAFRALNGLDGRHEFDAVDLRVAPLHQHSAEINRTLHGLADSATESRPARKTDC